MAHKEQRQFCKQVRRKFPQYFKKVSVIDVGSLDINGSNRYLFSKLARYKGIDVVIGSNVHLVGRAHEVIPTMTDLSDVMISTEALEHDKHWDKTLVAMFNGLKPGGLMLITCAAPGREEHGTTENHAWCSPGTNDHYENISFSMFESVMLPSLFSTYHLNYDTRNFDLQFYGIRV